MAVSEKKVIYDDGSEYVLPIFGGLNVLPNREGMLIIYGKEPSSLNKEKKYPRFFERPNNAAIYNSDGTLRHQLIVPNELLKRESRGEWYIHSTYYADFPSLKGWGVMVTNDHYYPDLCFCLYDGTPNLIWTGYSQDRR